MSDLKIYDNWLVGDTVAAIVIREPLLPVEGKDGVIFPATYAAAKDEKVFPGGYNIDPPQGEKNVCLIDSVGSQANRIEPLFAKPEYASLVPQIVIAAGDKSVNLLEAGHRAGDAIVRCTPLQKQIEEAFKAELRGDMAPLGKIAPTSLVFGVWDSRETQSKRPRLIASTVRAFDVQPLRRGAVYVPPLNYVQMEVFTEEDQEKAVGDSKNPLSKRGFVNALASATHGGVIAKGGVRRDVTFSVAALRLLKVGNDAEETLLLRRYILGLSLVALTAPAQTYLRQGCNLVPDVDNPRRITLVHSDGSREEFKLTHDQAISFAKLAADEFGVGKSQTVIFDINLAKGDLPVEGGKKGKGKEKGKKDAVTGDQPEAAS
ncbi:MAG TPA: type I-U CRISPR-associated RAMP protein Csb1/Cas7u [Tepidisphaeraceae bacterium]|nr:type I-U CRISPR-associated RAMP protein Csb1/Cas7u [Tepidisphaeraceae bacterium]